MNVDAALAYGGAAWPVFPVHSPRDGRCSCGRDDCDRPAKHPRTPNGLDDASCDPDVIARWWQRWPDANVGLRTGIAFDVLDLDSVDAEVELMSLGVLEDLGPVSLTAQGFHLLCLPTGLGNKVGFIPGADWRGQRGYIVAPPSVHVSGWPYEWLTGHGPDRALRGAPAALTGLLSPPPATTQPSRGVALPFGREGWSPAGLVGTVAAAPEGKRNEALYWASRRIRDDLHSGKCTRAEALDAAKKLAVAAERTGLTPEAVKATVKSGLRGPKKIAS